MLSSAIATRSALRSAITTSSRARVMSNGSTMHDNDPATLEREKHRNLTGEQLKTPHIKSAPGWNENLASASEAHVKADKHAHGSIQDLQRETVDAVQTKHSPDERISGRESAEQLDEVAGPLGGKVLQKRTVKETLEEVVEEDNRVKEPRR